MESLSFSNFLECDKNISICFVAQISPNFGYESQHNTTQSRIGKLYMRLQHQICDLTMLICKLNEF